MSDPIDLGRIESLAKEATPGPWEHHPHDERNNYTVFDSGAAPVAVTREWRTREGCAEANAAFIAALSPDVVLSLVGEVRHQRARADAHAGSVQALTKAKAENDERFMRERDEARRERDAYKRAVERMAHMAATLRTEAVGVSPDVQSIANKIAREIESRLEIA